MGFVGMLHVNFLTTAFLNIHLKAHLNILFIQIYIHVNVNVNLIVHMNISMEVGPMLRSVVQLFIQN